MYYYPIEEAINDCVKALGIQYKDANEMTEEELLEAERYLAKTYAIAWKQDPTCIQLVPYNARSGLLMEEYYVLYDTTNPDDGPRRNSCGNVIYFSSKAVAALKGETVEPNKLAAAVWKINSNRFEFRKSIGFCKRCGYPLFRSDIDGYASQCFQCNEDFFLIEQNTELDLLTK